MVGLCIADKPDNGGDCAWSSVYRKKWRILNMTIKINGKEIELIKEVTIKDLLDVQKVEMQDYVTVQLNDEIIPREHYDTYLIKHGDTVELLYFMGGG